MKKAVEFLRGKEWTMGNGQCHSCTGMKPGLWYPHPCCTSPDQEGHKVGCTLAAALESLGEKVVYIGGGDEESPK